MDTNKRIEIKFRSHFEFLPFLSVIFTFYMYMSVFVCVLFLTQTKYNLQQYVLSFTGYIATILH